MKLNSNFIMSVFLVSASVGLAACSGKRPAASAPAPTPDGGDAQRLVALIDYVGGDYGRAVRDGAVVSAAEYEEQLRFVADAQRLAGRLLGASIDSSPLTARLAEIEAGVRGKVDAEAVARRCALAKAEAVTRFGLPTAPEGRPSLARAEALYAANCAVCHGPNGDADTERGKALDPPPASFRDASRLALLSPYRVYNALTFGVPGTAMASFALSPTERWDLAFYVFRLGHADDPARGPVAMSLAELAVRSDHDILAALRAESHSEPATALAYLRRETAFREPGAGEGIDRTRRLVRQAVAAAGQGRGADAERLAIDAYLNGFEPLEARLRALDPGGTLAIESAFGDLRAALARGEPGAVQARARALDTLLASVADGERPRALPFAAAVLIYFREGVEAALLVGALLAGVRKLGRGDAARFIHLGWVMALPAGVATWFVFDRLVAVGAEHRELMEAVVGLIAAAVLFSVSFWMISKAESRHWVRYLKHNLEIGLSKRNLLTLSGLAFLAVYREAAETVLFTQALLLEAEGHRSQVWAGAGTGLAIVIAVALVLSRTVQRLPLGIFFGVSSVLLCALAASFAGSGMYALVAAGYLSPRPVPFPEIPWIGVHPDLAGLLVQLMIVSAIAAGGVIALRRRPAEPRRQ